MRIRSGELFCGRQRSLPRARQSSERRPSRRARRASTIEVLSSRPELVTGGDALVRISGAPSKPTRVGQRKGCVGGLQGRCEGRLDRPRRRAQGRRQRVVAKAGDEKSLTLTNHPINGTLFAGPQQEPFVCENETFGLDPRKGRELRGAEEGRVLLSQQGRRVETLQPGRGNARRHRHDQDHRRQGSPAHRPPGEGRHQPLRLSHQHPARSGRRSAADADRALAGIGLERQADLQLRRRRAGELPHGPRARHDDRHRQQVLHRGSRRRLCATASSPRGYAVAAGSLNVMGTNNDDVKSAETAAKVKEHFIKQFGAPLFTIGHGASGGSMQQHLIANAYPGLLDGIMPARSYAGRDDVPAAALRLRAAAERVQDRRHWTREQMDAVSGKYWGYCVSNGTRYPNARHRQLRRGGQGRWSPTTRAEGQGRALHLPGQPGQYLRHRSEDRLRPQSVRQRRRAIWACRRSTTARSPSTQFIDINTRVGGLDINGKIVPQRMVGDPQALRRAYETGRVNAGTGGLAIDPRSSTSAPTSTAIPLGARRRQDVDVHDGYHSAVMRARLHEVRTAPPPTT